MKVHGLLAEFPEPEQLLAATRAAYAAGYRSMDAYSPHEVLGVAEAMGMQRTKVPLVVLLGGVTGAATAYGMQWFSAVQHYPLNVGGRPLHSWPAFIPITFELTVLFASLAAVFGLLLMNGLPRPYHPVFNVPGFKRASQTHFFLCLEAADPLFEVERTRQFLQSLNPDSVEEVPE